MTSKRIFFIINTILLGLALIFSILMTIVTSDYGGEYYLVFLLPMQVAIILLLIKSIFSIQSNNKYFTEIGIGGILSSLTGLILPPLRSGSLFSSIVIPFSIILLYCLAISIVYIAFGESKRNKR